MYSRLELIGLVGIFRFCRLPTNLINSFLHPPYTIAGFLAYIHKNTLNVTIIKQKSVWMLCIVRYKCGRTNRYGWWGGESFNRLVVFFAIWRFCDYAIQQRVTSDRFRDRFAILPFLRTFAPCFWLQATNDVWQATSDSFFILIFNRYEQSNFYNKQRGIAKRAKSDYPLPS